MLTAPGEPAHVQRSSSPPTPPTGTSTLAREASARQPPTVGCSHERRQLGQRGSAAAPAAPGAQPGAQAAPPAAPAAALPRAPRLPVPSIIKAKKGRESSPNYRARKGTYSVQYCCLLYWAYILGLYTNIRWLEQAIQVCKLKRRASSQADPVPQPEEAEERDVVPS